MKSDDPAFYDGTSKVVWCIDCPFSDEHGMPGSLLCDAQPCPTKETYAAACILAEQGAL